MNFEPILNDLDISFAYNNPQYFRNAEREKRWGEPVYFFPSTNKYDELGCGGYYYEYGSNANAKKGYLSNCTYVQGCFYHLRSGIVLKEVIGRALDTFSKYKGRKDGGNLNGQYIGDTLQQGDMLIFTDDKSLKGDGHIVSVELIEGNTIHIMEGAYSKKSIYKDKACITYTLNKSDMFTGKSITLRPSMPYNEILYGVIHTGDVFDKNTNENKNDSKKLKQINKLAKEIVELSNE